MDTDLFQGVLLALLAIGLVVLIALLATLGGIRKALERRGSTEPAPSVASSSTLEPIAEAESEPEPEPEPEPAVAADTATALQPAADQPAADQPAAGATAPAASGAPGQADTIRSVLQQHGLSGAEATPQATSEPVVDSVFASHADDPQEEPFQRDGRWWFRRGDELLLYNEGTGQWEPAPDSLPGAAAPAPAAATPAQAEPVTSATTTATAMPAVADQVATFWKCPTCGAVNGSTAASCRMCFAARP